MAQWDDLVRVSGTLNDPKTLAVASAQPGAWVRRTAIERERRVLREHWKLFLAFGASVGAGIFLLTLTASGTTRGFLVGAAVASGGWLVVVIVMQLAGTATTRMGDLAERWTAEELAVLGNDWHVVHNVWVPELDRDADHVAIGPSGALVIETKWRSQPWQVSPNAEVSVKSVAKTTSRLADRIRVLLTSRDQPMPVISVVVWWSGLPPVGASGQPQGGRSVVMPGACLASWISDLPSTGLAEHRRQEAHRVLMGYAALNEPTLADVRPHRWSDIVGPFAAAPVAAFVGLFVTLNVWVLTGNLVVHGLLVVALVGIGEIARSHVWQLAVVGWITGVGVGLALIGAAYLAL